MGPAQPQQPVSAGTRLGTLLRNPALSALEARILLAHALQLSRVQLITQSERELTTAEVDAVLALFSRRLNGEPIAYIVGQREFFGLDFEVSPAVLIPRPETELLVELALLRMPQDLLSDRSGSRILELGTGSGAIAVALGQQRPSAVITALDVSFTALEIAQRNAARHHVDLRFLHSDWYQALGSEQFDLIVANPPYIVSGDPHLSHGDLRFEPINALTDHADGLTALRHIISGAAPYLAPQGWLLVEHGYDQATAVRALLAAAGFEQIQSWRDLAAIERVSGGVWNPITTP